MIRSVPNVTFPYRIRWVAEPHPSSDRKSNIPDYDSIPELSNTARANLRCWYALDYAFIELCEAWLNQNAKHIDASVSRRFEDMR